MYVSHLLTQTIHDELIQTALKRHERLGSFHAQSRHPNQSPLRRHLARTATCLALLSIVLTLVVLHAPPVGAQQEPDPVDSDQDGLTDEQEAEIGSDPNSYDTDGDGVADGGEVNAGTDPLDTDTDGDGFTDKEELDVSTNPLDSSVVPVPSEPSSIAITAYTCPAGYEGKSLFDDCTTPAAGVDVTVSLNASELGLTRTTNDAGQVAFSDLGPGAYTVHEDLADLDNDLERYTASCFGTPAPGAPESRQIVFTHLGSGDYGIELTEGEEITCTWFNIPAEADAQPTATATSTPPVTRTSAASPGKGAPVSALPNTGAGVTIADDDTSVTIYVLAGAALVLLATSLGSASRREP